MNPKAKKALLEMKRLGLLDVVKDIARKDKSFASALGNWAEKKADLALLFDLMDLGMPTGKRLGFLDARQRQRVREITVQMSATESDAFVAALAQPGKILDSKALAAEFGLRGKDFQKVTEAARTALLADPVLAASSRRLTDRVRQMLSKGGRVAALADKKKQLEVLQTLLGKAQAKGDTWLGEKFLPSAIAQLKKKPRLSDKQYSAIRRGLYQNGMKTQANLFRPDPGEEAPAKKEKAKPKPKINVDALFKEIPKIPSIVGRIWINKDGKAEIGDHAFRHTSGRRQTIDFDSMNVAKGMGGRIVSKEEAIPEGLKYAVELAKRIGKNEVETQEKALQAFNRKLKWPLQGLEYSIIPQKVTGGGKSGTVQAYASLKKGASATESDRDRKHLPSPLWYARPDEITRDLDRYDRYEASLRKVKKLLKRGGWPTLGIDLKVEPADPFLISTVIFKGDNARDILAQFTKENRQVNSYFAYPGNKITVKELSLREGHFSNHYKGWKTLFAYLDALEKNARRKTAKQFNINVGDSVLYGKYKNKKGRLTSTPFSSTVEPWQLDAPFPNAEILTRPEVTARNTTIVGGNTAILSTNSPQPPHRALSQAVNRSQTGEDTAEHIIRSSGERGRSKFQVGGSVLSPDVLDSISLRVIARITTTAGEDTEIPPTKSGVERVSATSIGVGIGSSGLGESLFSNTERSCPHISEDHSMPLKLSITSTGIVSTIGSRISNSGYGTTLQANGLRTRCDGHGRSLTATVFFSRRTSATFSINVGDSVLYGKYKNKKGIVKKFKTDSKGDVIVTVEPWPPSRKQPKELKLFKIRPAPAPWKEEKKAFVHDTDEAREKYLKEHPDADPSKHTVKDEEKGELPEDEGERRGLFKKLRDKAKSAVKGVGNKIVDAIKGEVGEWKAVARGVKKLVKREPMEPEEKRQLINYLIHQSLMGGLKTAIFAAVPPPPGYAIKQSISAIAFRLIDKKLSQRFAFGKTAAEMTEEEILKALGEITEEALLEALDEAVEKAPKARTSAQRVVFKHQERLAKHYPYQECLADGKKEGLNEEEARYRCQWIACCQSKRENRFKENGFCDDFNCDKKPKWKKASTKTVYTELKLDDEQGKEIGSWVIPEDSLPLLISDAPLVEKVAQRFASKLASSYSHPEEPFPPRRKQASADLAKAYHDNLMELRQEVREAVKLDLDYTSNLWVAWYHFYRAGRAWGQYVIDSLALPPKMAKPVEMAVRVFAPRYSRGKSPRNGIINWFKKNEKRFEVLDKARSWPERTEESGIFKQGPFTIHNTVQASGKALKNAESIIGKALKAVKKSDVPGFRQMAYGNLYLVGQLKRPNWAAWYMPSKDTIYLRPKMRGISSDDAARHLIHELGHRLWHKKIPKDTKTNWILHHAKTEADAPSGKLPQEGEILPMTVNNKTVRSNGLVPAISKIELVDANTGAVVGHVGIRQLQKWMADAARRGSFPTPYASTSPEEHFCEALSLFSTGKLQGRSLDAFVDIILNGGTGASAQRTAALNVVMASDSSRWLKTLEQNGLPAPPGGTLLNIRCQAGGDDWYAETRKGWFWWDSREKRWAYLPMGHLHMAKRVAAKYKNKKKVPKADGDGTTTVYEYSEGQVKHRNREKAKRVEKLRGKLDALQSKVKKDLSSKDLKTRLTALAVGLINDTFERVGNPDSAKDGHFGVTGWQAKHITISKGDDKATIKYIGKSGVSQEKETTDPDIIRVLKEAIKGKSGTDPVFEMDDVKVNSTVVNDYLKPMNITAKDIRGLHANRVMQEKLKAIRGKNDPAPGDKKKREKKFKEEFNKALEETAKAVGHEPATLKSQYLVPGLEATYLETGQVKKNLAKQASRGGFAEAMGVLDRYRQEFGDILFPIPHPQPSAVEERIIKLYIRRGETVPQFRQDPRYKNPRLTCVVCGNVCGTRSMHPVDLERDSVCYDCIEAAGLLGELDQSSLVTDQAERLIKLGKMPRIQYHATSWDRVPSILKKNLQLPRGRGDVSTFSHDIPSISTADNPKDAQAYHPHGALLEVQVKPGAKYLKRSIRGMRKGESLLDSVNRWGREVLAKGADGFYMDGWQSTVGNQTYNPAVLKVVRVVNLDEAPQNLKLATKTHAEKEDDEAKKLVKPAPKFKPPRKDLKKERMDLGDKDTEGQKADDDKDLSLNYKRVAARWLSRLAGKVPADTEKKKPGDYWETDKGGWGVKLPDGKYTGADDEEHAAAMASGKINPDDEEIPDEKGTGENENKEPKVTLTEDEKNQALTDAAKAQGLNFPEELEPEEAEQAEKEALAKKVEAEKEKAEAEAKEAEKKQLEKDIEKLSNEAERFGDPGFSDYLEGLDEKDQRTVLDAYVEEKDNLKKGVFSGNEVSDEAIEAATKALKGDISTKGKSVAQMGKALAAKMMAKKVVANPTIVGGQEISSEPMDAAALKKRTHQAFDQYERLSPELRQSAMEQAQVRLDKENDENKLAELQSIVNGLAMASIVNDEPITPLREEPSDDMRILAKALHEKGDAKKILGMSTDEFYSPEGRDMVSDAMSEMSDGDLYTALGGSDGPYGPIIDGLQNNAYSEETAAILKDLIQTMHLDGMTNIHSFLVETATEGGNPIKDPKKRKEKINSVMSKIKDDPETAKMIEEAASSCKEGDLDPESMKKCEGLKEKLRLRQIEVAKTIAEDDIGELPPAKPLTMQISDALEEQNSKNLEKKYISRDKED